MGLAGVVVGPQAVRARLPIAATVCFRLAGRGPPRHAPSTQHLRFPRHRHTHGTIPTPKDKDALLRFGRPQRHSPQTQPLYTTTHKPHANSTQSPSQNSTPQDKDALLRFGKGNAVDFVGLSFTRCAADVRDARVFLEASGLGHAKIIAKLENKARLFVVFGGGGRAGTDGTACIKPLDGRRSLFSLMRDC